MQSIFTEIIRKNSLAVILNIIAFCGVVANLYLASRLYPLAEADRRLEFRVDAAEISIKHNEETNDIKFVFIQQQLEDIKKILTKP